MDSIGCLHSLTGTFCTSICLFEGVICALAICILTLSFLLGWRASFIFSPISSIMSDPDRQSRTAGRCGGGDLGCFGGFRTFGFCLSRRERSGARLVSLSVLGGGCCETLTEPLAQTLPLPILPPMPSPSSSKFKHAEEVDRCFSGLSDGASLPRGGVRLTADAAEPKPSPDLWSVSLPIRSGPQPPGCVRVSNLSFGALYVRSSWRSCLIFSLASLSLSSERDSKSWAESRWERYSFTRSPSRCCWARSRRSSSR